MSTTMAPFPWQESQWAQMEHALEMQRFGHAWLLLGAADIGVRAFADRLAGRLLCEAENVQARPCGACSSCIQLGSGVHPDAFLIEPETDGKAIGIEPVRALIDRTTLTSGATAKVGIIDPADAMTIAAANSLLKTLEEPPAGTCLLLVCNRLARVPATVRSRCQQIGFPIPNREHAISWLREQHSTGEPEYWLDLAGGRPLLAARLAAEDDGSTQGSESPANILLRVSVGQLSPIEGARTLQGLDMRRIIPAWISVVQDLLRVGRDPEAVVNYAGKRESLLQSAQRLDERRLFHYLDALYQSVPAPSSSLNSDMQIEGLLADAMNLRQGGRPVEGRKHG